MSAIVPNLPIVNAGQLYGTGCRLAFGTTTTITATPGQWRDSTDTNDIVLRSTITAAAALANGNPQNLTIDANAPLQTLNVRNVGLNGIDRGVLAPNTLYSVFVVSSSTRTGDFNADNYLSAGILISLSATAPQLPAGYDMFRRIGTILTDNTAAPNTLVLRFEQTGDSTTRTMWYDTGITVVNGAAGAAFAAQSLAAAVPPQVTRVLFFVDLDPNAPAEFVAIRPTGSADATGTAKLSGAVAAVHQFGQLACSTGINAGNASIDWVTDAASTVTLKVTAYDDNC